MKLSVEEPLLVLFSYSRQICLMDKSPEENETLSLSQYLMLAMMLIAVAVIGWGVVFVAEVLKGQAGVSSTMGWVALICVLIYYAIWIRLGWRSLLLIFPIAILQCGGCVPFVQWVKPNSIQLICMMNPRQIGIGLKEYYKQYGKFPPAYIADPAGEPLSSWRIHTLPYLDQYDLYKDFQLDQPWDSPDNKPLSEQQVSIFQCPLRRGRLWRETPNHCSYVAVIGPETAWPGSVGRSLSEFTDGPENTILLVEIAAVDHPWAAPDYLTLDNFVELMAKNSPYGPSTRHEPAYINVLFANGKVRHLPVDLPVETWRALFTVSGGETFTLPPP